MSDFWRDLLLLLAAINPAAVALSLAGQRIAVRAPVVALGLGIALALYVLAATTAEPLLDALDIEPESFRIGAALVMAPIGAYAAIRPRSGVGEAEEGWRGAVFPIGIPLLASPAGLVAAISSSADDGIAVAIWAAVIAAAAGAGAMMVGRRGPGVALDGIGRLTGALLVVLAAALFIEGVRAV